MILDLADYGYFLLSFAALLLVVMKFPHLQARTAAAVGRLSRRGFHSTPNELPKFALLRMVFGIILAWRAYDIYLLLTPADLADPAIYWFAISNLVTGLLLFFGLGTQFVLLFLMIVQWQHADWVLGTATLGNDVAAILAGLLFWVNGGRYLSLDALVLRVRPRLTSWLLYFASTPTAATITNAKFLALFAYWLVCLYSLSMHLNESAWMTGAAGPQLLASNFMSKPTGFSCRPFEQYPWAVWLARVSLWLMLPWYLLILPAVLVGGWVRAYAIGWGFLFFALSKFVLILGWLGEIEFLLWLGLFWSHRGITHQQRLGVAYDDTCNLCDRTVQFVRRIDLFDRVALKPASLNVEWLARYGVTYERAMEDLHGIDTQTGHICTSYDFYLQLARQLVLLWPVYPVLVIGKWTHVGPAIYRWVAVRRKKLFGVCMLPSPKPAPRQFVETADRWQPRLLATGTLHMVMLGLFYILAIPAPFVGHKGWSNDLADAAHIYGITPIDVFNHTDLRMTENWFTLSLLNENAEPELVPLFTPEGGRLSYHRSDRVYFGNTLRYRRVTIDQEGAFYPRLSMYIDYLAKVYLAQSKKPPGSYRFRFEQYHQPDPMRRC